MEVQLPTESADEEDPGAMICKAIAGLQALKNQAPCKQVHGTRSTTAGVKQVAPNPDPQLAALLSRIIAGTTQALATDSG